MAEELLHYFCCFERNSLFAVGCVKGCSKHVSSVVAAARYCSLTPCPFHPFSKHPILASLALWEYAIRGFAKGVSRTVSSGFFFSENETGKTKRKKTGKNGIKRKKRKKTEINKEQKGKNGRKWKKTEKRKKSEVTPFRFAKPRAIRRITSHIAVAPRDLGH